MFLCGLFKVVYHRCMALFSEELATWLQSREPKTFGNIEQVFKERSFAIAILLLMFIPALPLPTGGVTHVFEIIAALLALEMIIGLQSIWVPKRWRNMELGSRMLQRGLPFMQRRIAWFERFAKQRGRNVMQHRAFARLAGLIMLVLIVAAFVAPPFSGMDTLPALGAVAIALSLIIGDALVFIVGCCIGVAGIGLIAFFGTAAFETFKHIL